METTDRVAVYAGHLDAVQRLRSYAAAPLPVGLEAALGLSVPAGHLVDSLTGLCSRAAFRGELQAAIAEIVEGREVEVVVLEVDGFDDMAEYLGRVRADEVIKAVAERVRETAEDGCTVGRLAGSAFGVCRRGPDGASPDASSAVGPLRAAFVAPVPIEGMGGRVHVRVRVGVAVVTDRDARPEDAIAAARGRPRPSALRSTDSGGTSVSA